MKIIINQQAIKREIVGSFEICGSEKDLLRLASQISHEINSLKGGFKYGWVTIYSEREIESLTNTKPLAWESPLNKNEQTFG